jgi:hypothetical protein
MTDRETAARERLREIAGELDALQTRLRRLREVAARLTPPPPPPGDELDVATDVTMDVATELRAVIECVLIDRLQPALRDLQRVTRR